MWAVKRKLMSKSMFQKPEVSPVKRMKLKSFIYIKDRGVKGLSEQNSDALGWKGKQAEGCVSSSGPAHALSNMDF